MEWMCSVKHRRMLPSIYGAGCAAYWSGWRMSLPRASRGALFRWRIGRSGPLCAPHILPFVLP